MSTTPSSLPPADAGRSAGAGAARRADAAAESARTAGVGEEAVLESLRAFRAEEIRREQGMVLLAIEWARLNPEELLTDEAGEP